LDRALQKDATINTVAFSDSADPTYLSTLAGSARGQYFSNPDGVTAIEVAASLFSNFNTFYRLTFQSRLHQTDQTEHTATVLANIDGSQLQSSTGFVFPQTGVRPAFNSLPMLWAWTIILSVALIFLVVRLFRIA
jgi:hypothetical protein